MQGFLATVVIAALIGLVGDAITRDTIPGGFWGAWLAGLLGAWIGAYAPLFSAIKPYLFGVPIIPTVLGTAAFVFFLGLFKSAIRQAS